MKNLILVLVLSSFVILSGCQKNESTASGPDYTANWVGTYDGPYMSSIQQIQINKVNNTTVQVIVKQLQFSYVYTATTLQNVKVTGNTAVINEVQNIIEETNLGPYTFNGTLQLNNGSVSLTSTAVSVQQPVNNENSPMNFSFTGSKAN
jgi:hypothetical protein